MQLPIRSFQSLQRRRSPRIQFTAAFRILLIISCLIRPGCFGIVTAFRPPSSSSTSRQTRQPQSSHLIPKHLASSLTAATERRDTSLQAISSIEDIIFSAQSTASSLANSVISSGSDAKTNGLSSLLVLYTAGLWTSFSPCSLGLLPITVSYISTAAKERSDGKTLLPALAFASGLALVFTALGVSASALGGVFGSYGNSGKYDPLSSLLLAAASSLVSVLMGLQLLELINIPLPSLDFKLRSSALNALSQEGDESSIGGKSDSLFDESGGLVLSNLPSNQQNGEQTNAKSRNDSKNEEAALFRTFLLGGTSALVASPCATPVLASLLAYLASASSSTESASAAGEVWKGAAWMLSYTLGYSTPLLFIGATGGQALVNLQKQTRDGSFSSIGQWITPLTGGVLIVFGMNGFLVALLGDPSLAGLAPIID